jgi:hypothetical protein
VKAVRRIFCVASTALLAAPSFANNIITAEHPAYGTKGYALQFDMRPTYQYSGTFVGSDGSTRDQYFRQRLFNFIFRYYRPNWLFRLSTTYSGVEQTGKARTGFGDTVMEAGASREQGPWRWRLLAYFKAPTGNFDHRLPVQIGSGQWDIGPNLWVTRYFLDKRLDLDGFAQYLYRFENPGNAQTPGKQFSYAAAASCRAIEGKLPTRLGVENRGVFDDPTNSFGRQVANSKVQVNVGPVGMIDLKAWAPGWTLWPTVLFDVVNRNTQKATLYYLKVQYNY